MINVNYQVINLTVSNIRKEKQKLLYIVLHKIYINKIYDG